MTEREADEALAGEEELVPLFQGSLGDVKRLWQQCLDEEVPAAILSPSGPGCGTKLTLLVREADAERVMALLRREWKDILAREGVNPGTFGVEAGEGEEPPCPACGTAAPLEDGACRECGLQLG